MTWHEWKLQPINCLFLGFEAWRRRGGAKERWSFWTLLLLLLAIQQVTLLVPIKIVMAVCPVHLHMSFFFVTIQFMVEGPIFGGETTVYDISIFRTNKTPTPNIILLL
jgi:hypothetical protein